MDISHIFATAETAPEIIRDYGALGILAYITVWLTRKLNGKIDRLTNAVEKLVDRVDNLSDKLDKLPARK